MANKTLKTRIQLKYDTYSNWTTNNPTPLSGEVCVVVVPAASNAVAQEPTVLLKVGDGQNAFNSLPFTGGIAADVYDWAKAATKPTYTADEITGLADYINGEIQDTDTQYTIVQNETDAHKLTLKSKESSDSDWQDVVTITTADTVYDDSALKALVGDTSVATQIANAISTLDLENTYETKGAAAEVKNELDSYKTSNNKAVSDIQDAIETLNGEATIDGSVKKTVADEVAKVVAGADKDFDTLKEISDWIASHKGDASAMNSAISALETLTAGFEDATIKAYIDDAITALKIGDYAKAADLTALATRVTTVETKLETIAENADVSKIQTIKVNGSALTPDGNKAVDIDVPTGALADKDEVTKADLASALKTEIEGKANTSDLADIATSGNVNDLVQGESDYIIFNCGSATVNI